MPQAPQKVALVTGAARGIGLATAKKFLVEGWRVALLDIEGELLGRARAEIGQDDATLALTCDVSDTAVVGAAMKAIERQFGRLDALVNNAGIAVFAPLMETSEADWRRVIEVNLTGPFLCTRAAVPVDTAMAKQVHTPEIRADYHDAIPLNRYGLEEELAEAIFFLCSERASYITGQILAVDGGFDAAGIGLPTLRGERRNGQNSFSPAIFAFFARILRWR